MNLKTNALMRLVALSHEPLHVKPRHDEFIEVSYKCRKQKKHRVLAHEGFRKPVPSESVIRVIEDAFLPSTEVIEFNNLFLGRLVVICKDAYCNDEHDALQNLLKENPWIEQRGFSPNEAIGKELA